MTRRQARKIPREWSRYDSGERKRRPRYTREQLGRARQRIRGGTVGVYRPGAWKFGRHYAAKMARRCA